MGRSKFDDIKEQAPEWMEKAKTAAADLEVEKFLPTIDISESRSQ